MTSKNTPLDLKKLVRHLMDPVPPSHRRIAHMVGCGNSTVRHYARAIETSGWNEADLAPLDSDELRALLGRTTKKPIDYAKATAILSAPGGTVRAAWEAYRAGALHPRQSHVGYQTFARRLAERLQRQYVAKAHDP